MSVRNGPTISASCHGCAFHEQERYHAQGDVGYDHYCHGVPKGRMHIPEFPGCPTPVWCPMLTDEQRQALGGAYLDFKNALEAQDD